VVINKSDQKTTGNESVKTCFFPFFFLLDRAFLYIYIYIYIYISFFNPMPHFGIYPYRKPTYLLVFY
jgi:hypothetical protein